MNFFIELRFSKKKKWLHSYFYYPHAGDTKLHLSSITKGLDELNSKYDNILFLVDLNTGDEPSLNEFCQNHNLEITINKPICFKNLKMH